MRRATVAAAALVEEERTFLGHPRLPDDVAQIDKVMKTLRRGDKLVQELELEQLTFEELQEAYELLSRISDIVQVCNFLLSITTTLPILQILN